MAKPKGNMDDLIVPKKMPQQTSSVIGREAVRAQARHLTRAIKQSGPLTSLTLRLDREAYKRLALYAVEKDMTHQGILEAALDEYLDRHK